MIIFYYNDNKQNDDKHIEKIFKDKTHLIN